MFETWVRHPQKLWLRKALFQIHRWVGIGAGLYILMMSVTGGLLVFRDELSLRFSPSPVIVSGAGPRMSLEAIKQAALRSHSGYTLAETVESQDPRQAVEIALQRDGKVLDLLFDPYTGADLGYRLSRGYRLLGWIADLHDNLLSEKKGRFVNGFGGLCLTLLALTGCVIWWPGIRRWRESLIMELNAGSSRFVWRLHSVIGFWLFVFVLLWGLSGMYLCFPNVFDRLVDFFEPLDPTSHVNRVGDIGLFWLSRLHFGKFAGKLLKATWATMSLVPATLFATGALIWWNRVVRTRFRKRR